jgi:hypothetical protein
MPELAALLVKHYDLHEGLFDLWVEFQIGLGAVGPDPSKRVPGAMLGLNSVSLAATDTIGPNTVDAAKINPRPRAKAAAAPQVRLRAKMK